MLKCCDSICFPKSVGGLKFRKIFDFDKAALSKLAWSFASIKDIIWVHFKAKYLREKFLIHFMMILAMILLRCGLISKTLETSSLKVLSSYYFLLIKNFINLILIGAIFHTTSCSDITFRSLVSLNTMSLNLVKDLIDFRSTLYLEY